MVAVVVAVLVVAVVAVVVVVVVVVVLVVAENIVLMFVTYRPPLAIPPTSPAHVVTLATCICRFCVWPVRVHGHRGAGGGGGGGGSGGGEGGGGGVPLYACALAHAHMHERVRRHRRRRRCIIGFRKYVVSSVVAAAAAKASLPPNRARPFTSRSSRVCARACVCSRTSSIFRSRRLSPRTRGTCTSETTARQRR